MEAIYRQRLTLLWWIVGGLVFILLIIRAFVGSDAVAALVTWLSTYLLPGLSLVSGTAVVKKRLTAAERDGLAVAFWSAFGASALYLAALVAAVVKVIFTTGVSPEDLLKPWGLILGLLQTLVVGFIGFFFAKAPGGKNTSKPTSS